MNDYEGVHAFRDTVVYGLAAVGLITIFVFMCIGFRYVLQNHVPPMEEVTIEQAE